MYEFVFLCDFCVFVIVVCVGLLIIWWWVNEKIIYFISVFFWYIKLYWMIFCLRYWKYKFFYFWFEKKVFFCWFDLLGRGIEVVFESLKSNEICWDNSKIFVWEVLFYVGVFFSYGFWGGLYLRRCYFIIVIMRF